MRTADVRDRVPTSRARASHLRVSRASNGIADWLGAAAATTEVARWLVPDEPLRRRSAVTGALEPLVDAAVQGRGVVDVARSDQGLAGVALWLEVVDGQVEGVPVGAGLPAVLGGQHLERFRSLEAALGQAGRAEPHLQLVSCVVDPDRRGRGIGSRLLALGIDRLDRRGTAASVVAEDGRLAGWYERFGFGHREVLDLPAGPSLVRLWRQPRPTG